MRFSKLAALVLLLLVLLSTSSCFLGNGLSQALVSLLKQNGVSVEVENFEAPLSGRAGYIVFAYNSKTETKIISAFGLKNADTKAGFDTEVDFLRSQYNNSPLIRTLAMQSVWGVTGHPNSLRLRNGSQFEYMYLVVTSDGKIYLFSQYTYG